MDGQILMLPKYRVPKKRKGTKKNMPTEQYVKKLKEQNPNIELVGDYLGMKTKTMHHCLLHDIYWETIPSNALRYGCSRCGSEKIKKKNQKTDAQYRIELQNINPNIIALEPYQNANAPILHQCLIDGYIWNARPANILSHKGCPLCAGNIKLSHNEYVKRLFKISPNIIPLELYAGNKTPILHLCQIHGCIWKTTPGSVLQGCGCKQCGIEFHNYSNKYTTETYKRALKLVNSNIILIDEYQKSNIPIKHQCILDGYIWCASPANILQGTGCPRCNKSHGESTIEQWLINHNIQYISQYKFQDCKNIYPLPFDFYLPEKNKCIEFDGEQHFRPVEHFDGQKGFEQRLKNDSIKNEYCEQNNIPLLRIRYDQNIEEELQKFLFT